MAGFLEHTQKGAVTNVKVPEHRLNKKIIWAISHGVVVEGGHWGHTITYVEEKTAERALRSFNTKLANHWTQKATIENVKQIKIHKGI